MKRTNILMMAMLLISCSENKNIAEDNMDISIDKQIVKTELQTVLDSANVNGAILIYDFQNDLYYSNDFEWVKTGGLPASTFKIVHSMIALETGVVENDSTLFKWDGKKRFLKIWEKDLILRDAFHLSCVPCYQDIARQIGAERMNKYLDTLNFGSMKVDEDNIDMFWLDGKSRINQFQQIDFLKRFYLSELPVSKRTEKIMKRMMLIEENEHYKLSGKTGWAFRKGHNNGWFVGYLETEDKVYFFATNVEPGKRFDMDSFPNIRKEVTYQALKEMALID